MINLRSNKLFVEDVPVKTLAKSYSTPLYAYSKGTIVSNLKKYKDSIQVCEIISIQINIKSFSESFIFLRTMDSFVMQSKQIVI